MTEKYNDGTDLFFQAILLTAASFAAAVFIWIIKTIVWVAMAWFLYWIYFYLLVLSAIGVGGFWLFSKMELKGYQHRRLAFSFMLLFGSVYLTDFLYRQWFSVATHAQSPAPETKTLSAITEQVSIPQNEIQLKTNIPKVMTKQKDYPQTKTNPSPQFTKKSEGIKSPLPDSAKVENSPPQVARTGEGLINSVKVVGAIANIEHIEGVALIVWLNERRPREFFHPDLEAADKMVNSRGFPAVKCSFKPTPALASKLKNGLLLGGIIVTGEIKKSTEAIVLENCSLLFPE